MNENVRAPATMTDKSICQPRHYLLNKAKMNSLVS